MNSIKNLLPLLQGTRARFIVTKRWTSSASSDGGPNGINEELLEMLVCPLSKHKLRYDAQTNELVNDKLGVAYPIKDGMPQLAPEDGRLLQTGKNQSDWST